MYPKYSEIQVPLLLELQRRGGSTRPRDQDDDGLTVYESLANHFGLPPSATALQIEAGERPENKWENMVRWARNDLKKLGQLDGSTRGVWAITPTGLERLSVEASEPHWLGLSGTGTTPEQFADQQKEHARIGAKGELIALEFESQRLTAAGRGDLAEQITHIALEDVGAGFDIRSFTVDGDPVAIEVKSTKSTSTAGFEITQNEWRTAQRFGSRYWVYRVRAVDSDSPQVTVYRDFETMVRSEQFQLQATSYRVVKGHAFGKVSASDA